MAVYPPGPTRMVDLPAYGANSAPTDRFWIASAAVGFALGSAADRFITPNEFLAEITRNITDISVQFGNGAGVSTVSAASKGKIRYSATDQSFQVSENGGAYQNLLKGVGVATRAAFWTSTTALGSNSDFFWDNVNERLGIGVGSTPDAPLDVLADGTALAQQWRQNAGPLRMQVILDNVPEASIGTSTNHTLHLLTNNLQRLTVENGGRVGINQPTLVQAQLEVVALDATTEGLIVRSATTPSVNIVEFFNVAALRYTFAPDGTLTLGLAGASGATGALAFSVNGQANLTTLRAGDTPASANTIKLPSDDPAAGEFLKVTSFAANVAVTEWATGGTVTGSGVATRVAFWTSTTALGSNSDFFWDNVNERLGVGVGSTPDAPLDVLADGTALAQQWRQNAGPLRMQVILDNVPEASIGTSTNHTLHLLSNNLQRLTVENSGRVGINQPTLVQAQLEVVAQDATTEGLIVRSAVTPSVNIVEFFNVAALRYTFAPDGTLTLGLAGASGATGALAFSVNGQANLTTLRAGDTPASANTIKLPSDDPAAGEFLKVTSFAANVAVTEWAAGGGATINPTDTLVPYRSSATAFLDSQLVRLSGLITELRNITTGTSAQVFNIYGTAANNSAAAPTEYVRAAHSATSTAINIIAEIATPSTTAVAGINVNLTASAAVAGASVVGAAAGGAVTITAGNAARLTSGNANGGTINLTTGLGIGTGISGNVLQVRGSYVFVAESNSGIGLVPQVSGFAIGPALFVQGGGGASNNHGAFTSYLALTQAISDSGVSVYAQAASNYGIVFASTCHIGFSSSSGTSATGLRDSRDVSFARAAAGIIRVANGTTGIGSLLIAPSSASVTGNFTVLPDNAATNSLVTVARLGVNSTGVAADGFGAALSYSAESSTTNDQETGRQNCFWTTASHANRTAAFSWSLTNNATLLEHMRLAVPALTSPMCLSIHAGTAPNVWTSGTIAAKLYLIETTLPAVGVAAHFSTTAADAPHWQILRGRGTNASPAAVQNGDVLGSLTYAGYTSTTTNSFAPGADIRCAATETWTGSANGSRMVFRNAPNAGTITERLSLEQTGTFRIGAFSGSFSTSTLLQVGNYASWNTDVVSAIYTGANGTKGLEIIGTASQTAAPFRVFLDSITPDLLTLSAGGVLATRAGTGSNQANHGGVLDVNTTSTANSGTGETDLMTYSLVANTLGTNGDFIHLEAWGSFEPSVNNKRVKVILGTTTLFDTGSQAFAPATAVDWRLVITIVRTGSATQGSVCEFAAAGSVLTSFVQQGGGTENLTTNLTLKVTGQGGASNEVFQDGMIVEWQPNA